MDRLPLLGALAASLVLAVPGMLQAASTHGDPALNRRLSDALGVKAWATRVMPNGPVKLVIYNCEQCRVGGFVLMDSTAQLITQRDLFAALDYAIHHEPSIQAQHSQVLLTRGGEVFKGVTTNPAGGKRLVFSQLVSECEACQPFASIRVAYDFDARGVFKHARSLALTNPEEGYRGTKPPMEQ